ncbi:BTB/POZ domain-containing protein [Jiangella alkaliphila]|uniref:Uncharacterized protein n=1 Tax=Jiangella alkaliphila TaxID=419479 RepID=A0A1H2LYS1_9ACTN|nr:hypothetical protein [Jiangella alkaliphila]SDU86153.1 hypothetical protein SAMN04488563_6856 [Jiangella alkaliphila]
MGIPDEGGEYTSIDVDALGQAVDDLAATLTGLTDKITGLESDFGYFGVDKTNFNKLMEAKSDLESITPDMRRRHSLAVQLLAEQQTNGWAGDGVLTVQGTDILNDDFGSVEEAQGAGSDLATQVNESGGDIPPEVYEQLEQYGHDPDFAEAFINGLSPASRALLISDARIQAGGGGGEDPNEEPQLAVAEVFATASFRIDYDAEFFRGMNDALRDMELPGPSITAMQDFLPLLQHGSWNHEALTSVADVAMSGDSDVTGMLSGDWRSLVFAGLARSPRASAEFMAEHRDDVWDSARFGDYESEEEFAAFLQAATVDAGPVYARLGLYDEDLPNLAEQNAAWLINQVGEQPEGEAWEFNEHMRGVFSNITEEYWDDFMYSFSTPAGVTDNPGRDGIEVDTANWEAFIMEVMRSEEGSADMFMLFQTQIGDMRDHRVEGYDEDDSDTAHATGWDAYVNRRLGNLFVSNWEQVLSERDASAQEREEFRNGVVDFLIGAAFDPKGTAESLTSMPKDIAQTLIGDMIKDWWGSMTEEEVQEMDTDWFGDRNTWMEYANRLANDDRFPIDPGYNDGTVTWDGDPQFYEESYGASFRDDSGNILPLDQIREDPAALEAYNAWLQDPAVQMITDPLFQPEVHSS